MLTDAQTEQYRDEGYLTLLMQRGDLSLHDSYLIHGSEPNQTNMRRAAPTIRYVPATTRIKDQPDRKQFLVRGRAAANGNVYYRFDP